MTRRIIDRLPRAHDVIRAVPATAPWVFRANRFLTTRGLWSPLTTNARKNEASWAEGTRQDRTPELFLHRDGLELHLFQDVLPDLPRDAAILELGPGPGRLLAVLHDLGYRDLAGVEISPDAIALLQEAFPGLAMDARVTLGSAPVEMRRMPSRSFDLVYCAGFLGQIGPRDNDLFANMARVARKYVVTADSEGYTASFPRDLQRMFERAGCRLLAERVLVQGPDGRLTLGPRAEPGGKRVVVRTFAAPTSTSRRG